MFLLKYNYILCNVDRQEKPQKRVKKETAEAVSFIIY